MKTKNAILAFFFSLLLPGTGQLYTGRTALGVFFIALTVALELGIRFIATSATIFIGIPIVVILLGLGSGVMAAKQARNPAQGILGHPILLFVLLIAINGGTYYTFIQPGFGTLIVHHMPNGSMEPLIRREDPIVLQTINHDFERGDVVALWYPRLPIRRNVEVDRIMGLPGDVIAYKDNLLYRDGELAEPYYDQLYFQFYIEVTEKVEDFSVWESYGIQGAGPTESGYLVLSNEKTMNKLVGENDWAVSFRRRQVSPEKMNNRIFVGGLEGWNENHLGEMVVPKKGITVSLDSISIRVYSKTMRIEDAAIEVRNNRVFRGGSQITEYTFKEDHYFLLSDSRDNGFDSRMWGFVPEDFLIGKALYLGQTWDRDRWGKRL